MIRFQRISYLYSPIISRSTQFTTTTSPHYFIHSNPSRLQQRRTFFGIGEILSVIANPGEVLKSLAESKKLLQETREELQSTSERSQIPAPHTFSPLPGFFPRPLEISKIQQRLDGIPTFLVLMGASSVGKTALLREVLGGSGREGEERGGGGGRYKVLCFDLRVSGFGDLESLFFSWSGQMERFFASLPEEMGNEWGWDQFEKESWAFKHDRIAIEKRIELGHPVRTSDISHLMELFQSALLKYWEFEPMSYLDRQRLKDDEKKKKLKESDSSSNNTSNSSPHSLKQDRTEISLRDGSISDSCGGSSREREGLLEARTLTNNNTERDVKESEGGGGGKGEEMKEEVPPVKKIPVFFLDEAHKLPALIRDPDAMKSILDAFLVLTKQDRLCHVVHCTSDSFYQTWLRKFNIMQHCTILTLGDPSKSEARKFWKEDLIPHVPVELRGKRGLEFERVYEVLGGKLAHLSDYVTEFINSNGTITPIQSSHFLQAYALLNLQFIHSMSNNSNRSNFKIHSSIYNAPLPSSNTNNNNEPNESFNEEEEEGGYNFTAKDLLLVMKRLTDDPPLLNSSTSNSTSNSNQYKSLPYFPLCRELGVSKVDNLVRAKVLELRWSPTITKEGNDEIEIELKSEGGEREEMGYAPILIPTTRVVGYAMGVVVRELKEAKRVKEKEKEK